MDWVDSFRGFAFVFSVVGVAGFWIVWVGFGLFLCWLGFIFGVWVFSTVGIGTSYLIGI